MRYRHIILLTSLALFLGGCSPQVGFGIGTAVGGSNGGAEILVTQDGVHGSVVAGGDFH